MDEVPLQAGSPTTAATLPPGSQAKRTGTQRRRQEPAVCSAALTWLPNAGVSGCSRQKAAVPLPLGIWHQACSAGDYSAALSCLYSALLSSSTTAPPMQGGRVAGLRPLHHLAKLLADNENSRKTVQMQAKKTTHQPSIPTPAQSWMHQNIPIFSDQSNNIVPTAVHPSRAAEFD